MNTTNDKEQLSCPNLHKTILKKCRGVVQNIKKTMIGNMPNVFYNVYISMFRAKPARYEGAADNVDKGINVKFHDNYKRLSSKKTQKLLVG